jgi:hypothetical protein
VTFQLATDFSLVKTMMAAAAETTTTTITTNNQTDSVIFIPQEEIFCGTVYVTEASTQVTIKKI